MASVTIGAPSVLTKFRFQIDLVGTKNGVNAVFTTPEDFTIDTEQVYYNGIRLKRGVGCDYLTSESGGLGTGYDTITLAYAPLGGENLFTDYLIP
ncbi:MAG TPA: hypothetical protein VFH61_09180 [Thermoleophilia bacterium]|nr:hypothetical protein [Thermoleophilia bacterium]